MSNSKKELSLPVILIYALLLNTGSSFMWPLTTIYMHDHLGMSLTISGVVLFGMSVFMIIGNYIGGYLFDQWSPYKVALISVSITLISVIILIFFHGGLSYSLLLLTYGLGNGCSLTLLNSYASLITSKTTRYVFNAVYIGLNVGVVVGTASVGYLLNYGITTVFIVAATFYAIVFFLTLFKFNINIEEAKAKKLKENQMQSTDDSQSGNHVKLLLLICLMTFAIYMSYTLWESVMSVRLTQLGISFEHYSLLWTINGLMIVFGQPLINKIGNRFKMGSQICFGISIFALSFFLLIGARQYLSFVVIIVILTFGEMNGLPSIPVWIDRLANIKEKGKYQGTYNVFMSMGRAAGPLIGGLFVELFNYPTLFIFAGGFIFFTMLMALIESKKANLL
ncbi:MFS transporter [Lactobacillus sp. S2-2]|uniref:MDR family MFS transporter n=1 Tax=Lactobacillus sp. S2-2 TaxID=2692917 RepID=UPI001F3D5CBC|nr:MFS transporter [Lactobacillus sp. S2-2]MCF6515306.1 MFS transporter [Lactobacillus sp. S2-2]